MAKNLLLKSRYSFAIFIAIIFIFTRAGSALAATANWTNGAGSGLWNTAGNWDTGSVPDSSTDVIIASSTNITITASGSAINFNSLTIGGGSATTQNLILTGSIGTGTNITVAGNGTITQNNTTSQSISGNLLIQSGGILTHTANSNSDVTSYTLNISANNITVNSGGSINVDGKGYGDTTNNTYRSGRGPGKGIYASNASGGSNFGQGGATAGGTVSWLAYGRIDDPALSGIGSSGGNEWYPGGAGGGLIILNAASTLTINGGTITADGSTPPGGGGCPGGGAGGSVKITADVVTGTPSSFTATGGAGICNGGDGGGGGVYIGYTTSDSITATSGYFSAVGGYHSFYANEYGGNGMALIKRTGTNGTLYLLNSHVGALTSVTSSYSADYLYLNSYALTKIPAGKTLTVPSAGSFGGTGGGELKVYGSLTAPSGAFDTFTGFTVSVYSGGIVSNSSIINISSTGGLYLYNGAVLSTNPISIYSTGTLLLDTNSVSDITNLWSAGTTNVYQGFANSSVGTVTINGGTMTMNNYTTSTSALALTNLVINSGGTLTHAANGTTAQGQMHIVNISANNITINSGGAINVDSKGFAGIHASAGQGPGGGARSGGGNGAGGGNGGAGGNTSDGGAGGAAYFNIDSPLLNDLGSSGGGGATLNGVTNGGGLILLNVANTLTINGTITAKGFTSPGGDGCPGGGSGGSVIIIANTVSGTPSSFSVTGGNAICNGGGGGGGGVYIRYLTSNSITSAMVIKTGGTGANAGGVGRLQMFQKIYALVGWWTFNGTDVTTSTVTDKSGQANTGTRYGGINMVAGQVGQAANFNGTNNYITALANNFTNAGDDRTISFWVRSTNTAVTNTALVGWGANSANSASVIELGLGGVANRKVSFYGNGNNLTSNGTLANNVWNYVTFVLSGTSAKIYINGVLDASGTLTGLNTSAGNFYMGSFSGLNNFKGVLDEVRVYSTALTAQQVMFLYNLGNSKMNSSATTKGGTLASNGLIGLWTFDRSDTSANTTTDKSGNANNATRHGTTVSPGKLGQALNFNGGTNYLTFGNTPSALQNLAQRNFSFCSWINACSAGGNNAGTIADNFINLTGGWAFLIRHNLGDGLNYALQVSMEFLPSPYLLAITNSNAVTLNKWQLACFTYDASVHRAKIYSNGVEMPLSTDNAGVGTPGNDSGIEFRIGNQSNTTNRGFDGKIDDVRIYNRILSVSEIQQLYKKGGGKIASSQTAAPKTSANSGLVGWWTFDGNDISGTSALDKSGSNNVGTLNGTISKVAGKVGQGLKFHGLATENITVADSASINPGAGDYSVAIWIKYYGIVDTAHPSFIYNDYGSNTNNLVNLIINYPSNKIKATYRDGSGNEILMDGAGQTLNDSKWHHLAWIKSGTTGLLYIDGTFVSSTVNNSIGTITTNDGNPVMIGRYSQDANNIGMFNGLLDDLRIYKRALSAKEVQALYKSGSGMKI